MFTRKLHRAPKYSTYKIDQLSVLKSRYNLVMHVKTKLNNTLLRTSHSVDKCIKLKDVLQGKN